MTHPVHPLLLSLLLCVGSGTRLWPLSPKGHHHRAEHGVMVEGAARATVGEDSNLVSGIASVFFVPRGAAHRLENPGKLALALIEVQTGAYLGEHDIMRYQDVHASGDGAKG